MKRNLRNKLSNIKMLKYLKIKLNEKIYFNYLDIVKKHSKKSKIIIDANEGWSLFFKSK